MTVREPTDMADVFQRLARHRSAASPRATSLPPEHWPNRAASENVQAGGLTWHVQRVGQGVPTLLLHGTGASTHSWDGMLERLATRHELFVPDLPGQGFSEAMTGTAGNPTLRGMAHALASLLEAQAFRPAVIIGHSAGAALALQLVLSGACSPRLVIGVNAALEPYDGFLAPIAQPLARVFAALTPVTSVIASRARKPGTVERLIASTGSSLPPEAIEPYRELLSRESHVAATLAMMAHWDLHELDRRLTHLPCPLCLVVGEADKTVPADQAVRAADRVPKARIIRLAALGHLAHEEQPEQVFNAIEIAEHWAGGIYASAADTGQ
ncbi:MAG: alpha/beta fold hydrolase BchO [Pseudomonadota bacterium]